MKEMIYVLSILFISCTEPQLMDESFETTSIKDSITIHQSVLSNNIDTLNILSSSGWSKINSSKLSDSANFSYLSIKTNPNLSITGIRKNLGFNVYSYDSVIFTINVDTISTFINSGYYPNSSPWIFSIMKWETYTMDSYLLKQGSNEIKLKPKKYYTESDGWNSVIISEYALNNAYPKFIKISSIIFIGFGHN